MYCRHCGSKVGDNDMVCANCGALTEYGERVANHDAIPPENNANAINPDGSLNKDAYRPGGTAGQNGGSAGYQNGNYYYAPENAGYRPRENQKSNSMALAAIIGGDSLSEIYTVLKPVYDQTTGLLDLTQSIYIDWGAFINAIINFLLIAFVLFCIVKTINRLNDAKDKAKGELLAERAAVKKYRREGLTKAEAMAKYQADLKAAEEAKAEEARLAADKAAAEKAAAEAKAEANTKLLEEIRDLLKNR